MRFQWTKDGNPVIEEKNIRTEGGTSVSVLVIDSVQISDSGNYTCIAKTASGEDSFSAQLKVNGLYYSFDKWCVIFGVHITSISYLLY